MGLFGKHIDDVVDKRVKDMAPGERGYIFCWAISFDLQRVPYLDLNAPVSKIRKTEKEKEKILIIRTGPGEADYDVDLRGSDYRWRIENDVSLDEDEGFIKEVVALEYHPGKYEPKKTGKLKKMSRNERLNLRLREAIKVENYEVAARIRDQLKTFSGRR